MALADRQFQRRKRRGGPWHVDWLLRVDGIRGHGPRLLLQKCAPEGAGPRSPDPELLRYSVLPVG